MKTERQKLLVVAAGAANVDVCGFSKDAIISGQSNPGRITITAGGGVRNSAETLQRLGVQTVLMAALGNDPFADYLYTHDQALGLNMEHVCRVKGASSMYLALLEPQGELYSSLADVSIESQLDPSYFQAKAEVLESANALILGSGLPKESLLFLVEHYSHKELFIDASSIGRIRNIESLLCSPWHLKMNSQEMAYIAGLTEPTEAELRQAAEDLIGRGVSSIMVTRGADGAFWTNGAEFCSVPGYRPDFIRSVNGAGDASFGAFIAGYLRGWEAHQSLDLAMVCAALCLMTDETVHPELSLERAERFRKEARRNGSGLTNSACEITFLE